MSSLNRRALSFEDLCVRTKVSSVVRCFGWICVCVWVVWCAPPPPHWRERLNLDDLNNCRRGIRGVPVTSVILAGQGPMDWD